MKVLFWGTPEFALTSLEALWGEGHDVVGVVTQPDRPAGRGRGLTPPPVKEWALQHGLPVLQPDRPRGADFEQRVRALGPDLSVVVAYGQILRREILDLPPRGSVNVHASLLPELRGAAPINWAIIRGHPVTGVSIMRMEEELDAGPVLLQVEEPIADDESATELGLRLAEIGAEALVSALALLEVDGLEERPQDPARATYAPKLGREDARIDWTLPAEDVGRWIRGLDRVPGAWSTLDGAELKLFRPLPAATPHEAAPGTVLSAGRGDERGILVACGAGAVWVREVKPAGKRRMSAEDWVRGRGAAEGDRLA